MRKLILILMLVLFPVVCFAARVWDEQLEAAPGYDETWSEGEVSVGTGTLDEDKTRTDVTGAPADWDDDCLEVTSAADDDTLYVKHYFVSAVDPFYWRIEIIAGNIGNLENADDAMLLIIRDGSDNDLMAVSIQDNAGTKRFRINFSYDGDGHSYYYSPISEDTRYRIELKWDNGNDVWEWKVDGASQDNGAISVDRDAQRVIMGLIAVENSRVVTTYYDNVAVDDADWVGSESGPSPQIIIISN